VDGGRQSFAPDPLNGGESEPGSERSRFPGDAVYVGGDFTSIGANRGNKIARISGTTGDADVQFDAHVSGGSNVGPGIFDIVLARSTLSWPGLLDASAERRATMATLNPPDRR